MNRKFKKVIDLVAESYVAIKEGVSKTVENYKEKKKEIKKAKEEIERPERKRREERLYVPFKIAKSLTELGYSWPTQYTYVNITNEGETEGNIVLRDKAWIEYYKNREEKDDSNLKVEIYPAPTILDAIDFLYDYYEVEIEYDLRGRNYIVTKKKLGGSTAKFGFSTPCNELSSALMSGIEAAISMIELEK